MSLSSQMVEVTDPTTTCQAVPEIARNSGPSINQVFLENNVLHGVRQYR